MWHIMCHSSFILTNVSVIIIFFWSNFHVLIFLTCKIDRLFSFSKVKPFKFSKFHQNDKIYWSLRREHERTTNFIWFYSGIKALIFDSTKKRPNFFGSIKKNWFCNRTNADVALLLTWQCWRQLPRHHCWRGSVTSSIITSLMTWQLTWHCHINPADAAVQSDSTTSIVMTWQCHISSDVALSIFIFFWKKK